MIDSALQELETLDFQIGATSAEDLQQLGNLFESRAQACVRLKLHFKEAGKQHLERIAAVLGRTNSLRERFTFLRNNAAEDLTLLHKQEQLLNLLGPEDSDPAYVDYSV